MVETAAEPTGEIDWDSDVVGSDEVLARDIELVGVEEGDVESVIDGVIDVEEEDEAVTEGVTEGDVDPVVDGVGDKEDDAVAEGVTVLEGERLEVIELDSEVVGENDTVSDDDRKAVVRITMKIVRVRITILPDIEADRETRSHNLNAYMVWSRLPTKIVPSVPIAGEADTMLPVE